MDGKFTTLERAFDLARSGIYASATEIKRRLTSEGYDDVQSHIYGLSISRQLNGLCQKTRAGLAS